ncbi:OmpA family protein [Flagellimonas eckloniae]|uniref:Flagellar motor protein MotB n=1 Tax=Flagellimonas eckloniae TaxID=346185 RepID=A0A0Q0XK27_9FLAO|nr:OmpA family protein [Allomuricauda eckloniae]KQC29230.1 flagellar motor protein MotB [Allomuricauda eckloniae]
MSKYKILIAAVVFLIVYAMQGQKSKVKKANEEFDEYAYIDARKIYLKVVDAGYESAQVFKKLGDTYYFNGEYGEAVKWYKNLMEKYSKTMEPIYYYRAAQSFKSIGEYYLSKKLMGEFSSRSANTNLARNFVRDYPALDSLVDFESKTFEIENVTNDLYSSDFGPSFFGDKLVYASSSESTQGDKIHEWNGIPYLNLYEATIDEEGKLSKPTPLKGAINSPLHESSAVFTNDGRIMYFTRNNYINGKKKKTKEKFISLKIYKAIKQEDGSWGDIKELPFNSDSYSVAHPALSPDEERLYFSSDMPGSYGESDIWYVNLTGNFLYSTPINMGAKINTEARETFPYISKNNNLYFSSDGHLSLGGLDIFAISLEENGDFKQVTNLKQPINTNKDDFGFIINEEKQIGYLSSNRDGNAGSVSDDIYRIWEKCGIINIEGVIADAKTGNPINRSLVTLLDENNTIVSQVDTDSIGQYKFEGLVDCGKQYAIRGENNSEEYNPTEKTITTPRGSHNLTINIELVPPDCPVEDLGCRLNLQPIYFDYGKYKIRPDAEIELAKIFQAMKEYPQLKIHIESHTDSKSSYSFNLNLSEKRAWTTMQWLINKGIDGGRLTYKGYGETQLLNECSNGVRCSDEQHQLNRRSMFIIQK